MCGIVLTTNRQEDEEARLERTRNVLRDLAPDGEGLSIDGPVPVTDTERVESAETPPRQLFRGHIPELDGLRAAAMLMVLLCHFWPKSLSVLVWDLGRMAWLAMDSFFVLSGFLIAGILLDTRLNPDYYRSYYIRRSLRILPLYYCVLTYLTCASMLWRGGAQYRDLITEWGSPAWFFVYLGNVPTAIAGAWPPIWGFGPLWSLQVEEQFYLLFPFAIRHLRPDTLSRVLWVAVFLSPVLRVGSFWWNPDNPHLQYVLLPSHMEGLALGALIAIRFRAGPWEIGKARLTGLTILLLTATCVGSSWGNPSRSEAEFFSPFNRTVGYSLASVACACLLLWLIRFRGSRFTRWLRISPMQYLGKISYGIYLLHMPVLTAVYFAWKALGWDSPHDDFLRFVAVTGLSIASASVSWYVLERPLLSLKDRVAPLVRARPEITTGAGPHRADTPARPLEKAATG